MTRRLLLAALAAACLYLAWTIAVALRAESVFTAGPRIVQEPWTWVTVVDLYLGFLIAGGVIVLRERAWRRALPWLVAMFCLGNLATAAYAAWALRRAAPPGEGSV